MSNSLQVVSSHATSKPMLGLEAAILKRSRQANDPLSFSQGIWNSGSSVSLSFQDMMPFLLMKHRTARQVSRKTCSLPRSTFLLAFFARGIWEVALLQSMLSRFCKEVGVDWIVCWRTEEEGQKMAWSFQQLLNQLKGFIRLSPTCILWRPELGGFSFA